MNRWASRKSLVRKIEGELLLRSQPKPWRYLWEPSEVCNTCCLEINTQQPVFRCYRCTKLIHYVCLMENSASQKIPICQACASPSIREVPEQEHSNAAPLEETARGQGEPDTGLPDEGPPDLELRDPYLNPLEEIVLDAGSLPCAKHGYDHLSRDSTCEFCKRALGPLYRHLSKKYGRSLGDQTPTLSFDFCWSPSCRCHGCTFHASFCVATRYRPIVMGICGHGKNQGMCSILLE